MSKTVVVHQPDFLPYLGFFHRFVHADVYIALDHVQFVQGTSKAWTHRDKIKTRTGAAWLSLSVEKCPINTPIEDVKLSSNSSWREDNLNVLRENYRRAPFFEAVYGGLVDMYRQPFVLMAQFNLALIGRLCDWLDIRIPCVRSSEIDPSGSKSELVASLVESVGGARYLSGVGARAYHDQEPFDQRGIEVVWQEFRHPTYPQQFGDFLPGLSIVDALFNCGPAETARMLRSA